MQIVNELCKAKFIIIPLKNSIHIYLLLSHLDRGIKYVASDIKLYMYTYIVFKGTENSNQTLNDI